VHEARRQAVRARWRGVVRQVLRLQRAAQTIGNDAAKAAAADAGASSVVGGLPRRLFDYFLVFAAPVGCAATAAASARRR
jgi:hypothetical protein